LQLVMMLTPETCRAARGMLDWSRADLAGRSGVADRTIVDFEAGDRQPRAGTMKKLRDAFEAEGIVFLPGTGVKLNRRATSRS
jgi:predicted transcriptional regulator